MEEEVDTFREIPGTTTHMYLCTCVRDLHTQYWISGPPPHFIFVPLYAPLPFSSRSARPSSPAHFILPFVREIMMLCVLLFLYEICMRERNHVW